ncbi:hypothetical protein [Arcicella rigui]|uniref:Uncharacterized protein n=1 Tax=Arcicella rigui TaxID=797020 RepID=A0ABU5QCW5_9BACT|nr:hypothetical protein [Arcicella rigui]MEA5140690.1 hypothetical protein [Arcicella rigui]
MEPITTTAIATVVTYLAGKLKENQSVKSFFDDFTEATVNWIRPIFLKEDGTEKSAIQELKKEPDNPTNQGVVQGLIVDKIEDNPAAEKWLLEMAKIIAEKPVTTTKNTYTANVQGNNNKVIQGISGSSIIIK